MIAIARSAPRTKANVEASFRAGSFRRAQPQLDWTADGFGTVGFDGVNPYWLLHALFGGS